MCADHLERLARVKAELNQGGMFSQRSDQRRVKRGPTCSSIGCMAPRPKGAKFCEDCERAFEAQGEAA